MLIAYEEVSEEAITGLAEEYLTSGADQYRGDIKKDVKKVVCSVKSGELLIMYSLESETCRLVAKI